MGFIVIHFLLKLLHPEKREKFDIKKVLVAL
jgi:hypothetical protein